MIYRKKSIINLKEKEMMAVTAPLTELPAKPRKTLNINNQEIPKDGILDDMTMQSNAYDEKKSDKSDTELIKGVLDSVVTLFKKPDTKVMYRNQSEKGVLYDVYFNNNHTILYIQPDELKVFLINRSMDNDHFADVLEDIQEMEVEEENKTVAKKLIAVARESMKPLDTDIPIDDIEEVEDYLSDIEDISDDGVVGENDGVVPDDIDDSESVDTPNTDSSNGENNDDEYISKEDDDNSDLEIENALGLNDDPTKEDEKDKYEESLKYKKEKKMKRVKDVEKEYGFSFVSGENEALSMAQYFHENRLREFGSFYIKLDEGEYKDVYGVHGVKPDGEKEVFRIVENGKFVYDTSVKNIDSQSDNFRVGERVKIDLSLVSEEFARQVFVIARRNKNYAIVESIDGENFRISENKIQARSIGGIPINKSALVKIDIVERDVELGFNTQMGDEIKKLSENFRQLKESKKTYDNDVIPVDIMNSEF